MTKGDQLVENHVPHLCLLGRNIKVGLHRYKGGRGTVFCRPVVWIKAGKSESEVLPSLAAWSTCLRTLRKPRGWTRLSEPSAFDIPWLWALFCHQAKLVLYIHSSDQLVVTAYNFKNQREHFQQHNLKTNLLRWVFYYLWWSKADKEWLFCQYLCVMGIKCVCFSGQWFKGDSDLFKAITSLNLPTLRSIIISPF